MFIQEIMWACADKMIVALPKLKTSAKSVQTTAEVCAQLKSPESTTYLQFYVRVLTEISAYTYYNEYVVLISVSTRKHISKLK